MSIDLIGEQLGSYRLKQLLGEGGYAQVYLGDHKYIKNRKAAIKVLKSFDLTEEEQTKFRNEAQTIADLDHPHIIRILDFGIEPGPLKGLYNIPYIVMTLAREGSLRNRYPEGTRLPLDEIVSYINQMAEALQYAHDQPEPTTVVHCDVKPENMLYFGPNEIRLSDFGIAVVNHKSTEFPMQPEGSQKHGQIKVFGTINYMAKERFYGQIKRASDQYSLAVVAYEWLTGYCPFVGNDQQIMYAHVQNEPPPLHSRFPDIPEAVEAVVMRALSKEPQYRYLTVKAFAEAFTLAAQGIMPINDDVKISAVDDDEEVTEEIVDDHGIVNVGEAILLPPSQQPIEPQVNDNMVVAPAPLAVQSNQQEEANDELPESQVQQPTIPKAAVLQVDNAAAEQLTDDSSPSAHPVIPAKLDEQLPDQEAGTPPVKDDSQLDDQEVAQQQANRASPPPLRPSLNQQQVKRASLPPPRPNPIRVQAKQGNAQKQRPNQQGGNQQPNQAAPPPPRPRVNRQQANQGSAQAPAGQQQANQGSAQAPAGQQQANRQQAYQQRANRQQANQGGAQQPAGQQPGNQGGPSPNANQRQGNQPGSRQQARSTSFHNSPTAGFSSFGSGAQAQARNEFLETFDFVPDWLKPFLRTFRPFAEMREFVAFRLLNYVFIFISAVLLTIGLLPLWFLTIWTLPLMILFFRFFFLMLVNRVVAGIAGALVALYYGICWTIFAIFLSSFPYISWLSWALVEYIALLVCIISFWFNIRYLRKRLKY